MSRSRPTKADERKSGFTLIETLVALSVLLAFAGALGPFMFQARHILVRGGGQIRAELLLRSLLDAPFDRAAPQVGEREGQDDDLRWRIDVEPWASDVEQEEPSPIDTTKGKRPNWSLFKVTAHVFWGDSQIVTAETLQLGRLD